MKLSDKANIVWPQAGGRVIVLTWTGPYTEDQYGDKVAARVKLRIAHDKDKKAYVATISRCTAATNSGGWTMERFEADIRPGGFSNMARVAMLPVARHTDKALRGFADQVIAIIDGDTLSEPASLVIALAEEAAELVAVTA